MTLDIELPELIFRRPGSNYFTDSSCHIVSIGCPPDGYVLRGAEQVLSFPGEVEIWHRQEESGEVQ